MFFSFKFIYGKETKEYVLKIQCQFTVRLGNDAIFKTKTTLDI